MKLNKKEYLSIILILGIGVILNIIVMKPIKNEIIDLSAKKEFIINKQQHDSSDKSENNKNNQNQIEYEDIVLKLEQELNKFIDVIHVNKFTEWDENNNEVTKIELKVSGSVEQVLNMNSELQKIKSKNNIENIQINKKLTNNVDNESEIKVDILECVMTLRVI